MKKFVTEELIFMTVAGSRMYGTDTSASDVDKRGVCVPPRIVVMGFERNFNQQEFPNEDTTVFSLQKFMKLAVDCNPNIIELLFAPEKTIETIHPTWERLLERRQDFLSAKAYHTFTGYAHSQLKRIKGHRAWLQNPPTHQPTREEFGLTQAGQGVRELARGIDLSEIAPETMQVIEKEKRYKGALTTWNQYQKWKKERNPARAALEAAHGLDTKHAMHLMRLLRMGKEILTTGKISVRRPDAEELLAIRNGAWTYDELVDSAEALKAKLDKVYEDKTYVVPFGPPKVELSDFCVELHDYHWTHHSKSTKDE
jgi:predicted nucleotidyltransferase